MKNKDNIEILTGQVWDSRYEKYEVICVDTKNRIAYFRHVDDYWFTTCGGSASVYLHRLISCPVLGDMSGWEIVTEQQKRDYNVPEKAEVFAKGWYPIRDSGVKGWPLRECRVPHGIYWETYRKNKEPLIPKEEISEDSLQSIIQCSKCSKPYFCACGTELRYSKDHYHIEDQLEKAPQPPEGYRIATREERETYDYPTDCKVKWLSSTGWKGSCSHYGWNVVNECLDIKFFAVPTGYVFKKEEQEQAYGLPMDHVEKVRQQNHKTAIEQLDVSDVGFDVVECAIKINEIINHMNKEQGQ